MTRAFSDLTRPAPLAAAAVLALNDHVLKSSALAGPVTGKLSDLAGLFVAPIVLVALVRAVARVRRDGAIAAACVLSVAIGFALLKSSSTFNDAINSVWGHHVLDRSDLWCLPMTALAWVWLGDRERRAAESRGQFRAAVGFAGVLLICAATPAPPPVPPPNVPMWSIASKPLVLSCGTAEVWVSKSGKTGIGITVHVLPTPSPTSGPAPYAPPPDAPSTGPAPYAPPPSNAPMKVATPGPSNPPVASKNPACDATVAARLRFPDRVFEGVLVVSKRGAELSREELRDSDGRRARPDPRAHDGVFHYLGFELDNEARWNRGERTAIVELEIYIAGQKHTFALPATHAYREFPPSRRW